jgi:hypothetical protein
MTVCGYRYNGTDTVFVVPLYAIDILSVNKISINILETMSELSLYDLMTQEEFKKKRLVNP